MSIPDPQQVMKLIGEFVELDASAIMVRVRDSSGKELEAILEAIYSMAEVPDLARAFCRVAVHETKPEAFALSLELLDYVDGSTQHETVREVVKVLGGNRQLAHSQKLQQLIRDLLYRSLNENVRPIIEEYDLKAFLV